MSKDKFKDALNDQAEENSDGDDGQNDSCCDDDSITTEELQVRENSTLTAVWHLWKEGTLVDFTIKIEDHEFKVHKVILGSMSDYFKVMLTGSMVESHTSHVNLTGAVTIDAMEILLEFIYTNKIKITKNNVRGILRAAMYLQVPTLINKCTHIIINRILWSANCFEILSEFKNYALTDSIKAVQDYIRRNKDTITKDFDVQQMSCEDISMLAEVWEESEMKLFHFLVAWIDVDPKNRNQHWNELMTQVRFCLLSPSEIETIKGFKENHKCQHFIGPWCDLVDKAAEYHELPMHKKVLDTTLQTKVRAEPALHAFSRDVTRSPGFFVHRDSSRWVPDERLTPPEDGAVAYSLIVVNNFLIVFTDQKTVYRWLIFDPRTLTWSEMAKMPTEREGFALVHHDTHLYTLGGSILHPHPGVTALGTPCVETEEVVTDIVEQYDLCSNTWRACSKLPVVVRDNAACVFGDSLYNSGGRQSVGEVDEREDDYPALSRVDCFHLSEQTWESKAPMLEPRGRHLMSVMRLHKEEVVCVVDRALQVEYYSPSTDQWTRCWEFNFTREMPPLWPENMWMTQGNSTYMLDINMAKAFSKQKFSPDGAVMLTFPTTDISLKAPVTFFDGFPFRKEMSYKSAYDAEDPFPICALLAIQHDPLSQDDLPGNQSKKDEADDDSEWEDESEDESEPEDDDETEDDDEPDDSSDEDDDSGNRKRSTGNPELDAFLDAQLGRIFGI